MTAYRPNVLVRLRIKNYRGIEFLDTNARFPNGIPAAGMVIKGPNGAGKTSVLNAILAACNARDIGPDAIRLDSETSELRVDMTQIEVTRTITESQSRLVVKDHTTNKPVKAPSDWLRSMIGTTLDPLEFMRMKNDKQKAYVLSAIPITVEPAQVQAWLGEWTLSEDVELNYGLHGLEVVSAIRKDFYDRRSAKNAEVKALDKDQTALEAGAPPAPAGARSVEDADAAAERAAGAVADLKSRAARVAQHEARTADTRERARTMREEATALESATMPAESDDAELARLQQAAIDDLAAKDVRLAKMDDEIAAAEARLEAMRKERREEGGYRAGLVEAKASADRLVADRAQLRASHTRDVAQAAQHRKAADDLEAAVAATSEKAPTTEEIEAAANALAAARAGQADAKAAELRRAHDKKITDVATRRSEAEVESSKLDAMVVKFSKDVPNQLLTEANGIPGLSIDDEEVSLDGVRFSKLSGRERLLFCVRLARRLNTRAKILVTDGLEAVDADLLPEFIAEATADGYQLIATRVEAGDITFEALSPPEQSE